MGSYRGPIPQVFGVWGIAHVRFLSFRRITQAPGAATLVSGQATDVAAERGSAALVSLVISLRTAARVVIDAALLDVFQAASSRHTLLELRSDLAAFDLWCRKHRQITLPASPTDVANYLIHRAEQGANPPPWRVLRPRSRGCTSCLASPPHHCAASQADLGGNSPGQGWRTAAGHAAALQVPGLEPRARPCARCWTAAAKT